MITNRLTTIAAVTALGLFAAGCGDDDSTTDSAATPAETSMTAPETKAEGMDTMAGDQDIVELAMGQDDLSTLVSAVKAADLVETLQGEGPFTVFAPTNEAFAALGEDTLTELTTEKTEDLKAILLGHVVAAEAMAGDLKDGQMLETVGGKELEVSIDGDTVKIGDATVAMADVDASNGVVHVIDTVLQ